jgi:polyphosphate kinase
LYLGSADLMERNLDRRVEVLFPIEDAAMREGVVRGVMEVQLRDTVNARRLRPDGVYERVRPGEGEPPLDSQAILLERGGIPREHSASANVPMA